MTEAIDVNATEVTEATETETIAESHIGKENAGGVDHLVTIDPEENTTTHIPQAAPTETVKGKNAIPIVGMMPNGIVTEVQEEEMATDLRAGICLKIVEVAAAIETGIKTVVSRRTETSSLRKPEEPKPTALHRRNASLRLI